MKKKFFLITILFICFMTFLQITSYAGDLDKIKEFNITADPQDDGEVDFVYTIKWEVLDSTSEGPLTWVQIGIPNSNVTNITALTDNISSVRKYNSDYIRIDFDDEYVEGETVTFSYSFTQKYLGEIKSNSCVFEYTPAWFDYCVVEKLTIKWNRNGVSKSDNDSTEGNYLIWSEKNIKKGKKVSIEVEYDANYFTDMQVSSSNDDVNYGAIVIVIFLIILVAAMKSNRRSYTSHRGYYGRPYTPPPPRRHHYGYGYGHRPPPPPRRSPSPMRHSSPPRRSSGGGSSGGSSCACACACAGSGRAGCSKKDFYGTKLKSKMILDNLK